MHISFEPRGQGRRIDSGIGVFWRRARHGFHLYALCPPLGLRLTIRLPTTKERSSRC